MLKKFLLVVTLFLLFSQSHCQNESPVIESTTKAIETTVKQSETTQHVKPSIDDPKRPFSFFQVVSDSMVDLLERKINFIKRATERLEGLFAF